MATVPTRPLSQNKYTEQNMGNTSFDEDFGVNAVEMLGYDGTVLRRVKVGTDGTLPVTATIDTTGLATSAKQDTGNTSLGTIDTTLGATSGAAVVTDVNGTIQQYLRGLVKLLITSGTIVLGAGSAAIGKLAANDGVDIGDVTINNSTGASAVNIQDGGNTITVDGTGTLPVQESGAALTSLQLIDDTIYTSGDALAKTLGIAAQFDDVTPGAMTENKMGPVRMSSRREAYTQIRDAAGNERGLNVDTNGAIAVTATNATASNLKVAATLDAETTKVIGTARVLGNGGATLDATVGAGTAPTNQVVVGALYNSTEISPTTGQAFALQADAKGRVRNVIMDAAGNTRGANVDSANRLSVTLDNIGKTIKSVTGTVSVDTDIVAAVAAKRIKVIAYSLITASTTANTITFQSNASTALWTIPLQAITGTNFGANLSIGAPSFLFATTAGEKLTLDVSAAQSVTYSVTYFDDDAS